MQPYRYVRVAPIQDVIHLPGVRVRVRVGVRVRVRIS